ncbi:MAG: CBS domain-containing protein [Betaproteobacteria bacterium]|nr:CBS domain-containing protein [Betaproteobacteria bacterium]NBT11096.1 CBS domain-containing protein [Betaproteobacteria bacterium]NBU49603.1 CBS domain-containing protein [Betaproteobacteria bacterium]
MPTHHEDAPGSAASPEKAWASPSLAAALRERLSRHLPFSQMRPEQVDRFLAASSEVYFAPGEVVLQPEGGVVESLYFLRQGSVTGLRGAQSLYDANIEYAAGDLFPIAAFMGRRPVSLTLTAHSDTFCLQVPRAAVESLAADSAPFAGVLSRQMLHFIEASRRALQLEQASAALASQTLERPLGELIRRAPITCNPQDPIEDALRRMHEQRRDSVHVVDELGAPLGILTRFDVLGRITLPGIPLEHPIKAVMTSPVKSLSIHHTAADAAILMTRLGLRHVPVTREGVLVGVVTERDLFAMQQMSIKQLHTTIRTAATLEDFRSAAADIRQTTITLLAQGVQAQQLTELISHLNDVLTQQLVAVTAKAHGLDLSQACWLAFGSEGRSEQTVATDQDNGLVFVSEEPDRERPAWLAFAHEVNESLAACGYPLCKGHVMARNPACCLTPQEWQRRFSKWIEQGSPEDLLAASIYFDLRPVAGQLDLAQGLKALIADKARANPRFCRQLAEEVLRSPSALGWLGGIEAQVVDGVRMLDLKLHGTAVFVAVARLRSLAQGITEVNTRRRLLAVAHLNGVPEHHAQAWVSGFEFLQMLRLRTQIKGPDAATPNAGPNHMRLDALNDIDERILKETLRLVRRLQQDVELDYRRL